MQEQYKHSLEEISKITQKRALSDAEKIKEGASYVFDEGAENPRLEFTKEQIDDARKEIGQELSQSDKEYIKQIERTSINFPALVQFYEHTAKETNPIEQAMEDIRNRSLIICGNDPAKIDEQGLPIDRRDFAKLEKEVKRFLNLAQFNYSRSQKFLKVNIKGQKEPEKDISRSQRGKLDEVLDRDDKIIGPYIQELEEVTGLAGKTTEGLTWRNCKIKKSKDRERILQTCFSIGRDMVFIIGEDKYDQIRKRVDLVTFQTIDSDTLLSTSAALAAVKYRENNIKGYWNSLPRVWIEELMILVKNPDLAEDLANTDLKYKVKGIRDFAKLCEVKVKEKEKPFAERLTEKEYLLRNITPEELPEKTIKDVLDGLTNFRFLEGPSYSERASKQGIERLQTIIRIYFYISKDAKPSSQNMRSRLSLEKLVSVILNYQKSYKQGDPALIKKQSSLADKNVFDSASIAIREGILLAEKFEPKSIQDEQSDLFIKIEPTKISGHWMPTVKIFNPDTKILILDGVERENLDISLREKNLEQLKQEIENLFRQTEADVSKRKNSVVIWNDPDGLYNIYAKIRYAWQILPKLYPEVYEKIKKQKEEAKRKAKDKTDMEKSL